MSGKELKKITSDVSFDAMKFGSERDLRLALTELKWIKRTKDKLIKSDFETVSGKYKFPIDFLKEGLKGFSYPEDHMVSKSKWFPIIYSWWYHERELGLNLFKFQIDYVQTLFRFSLFLAILGMILFQMSFTLQHLLDLDLLQFLSIIIFPFAFFIISLGAELRNGLSNKKMQLDEYTAKLKGEGYQSMITANEKFIREHHRMIAFAGGTFLKTIQESPSPSLFYIGMTEIMRPIKISWTNRLLAKLRLLPKQATSTEKERIPIFDVENPYSEYIKRIEEISESKPKQDEVNT